jgi:phosphatidylinositol kinase/protein kinase (PI-3  family)
VIQNANGFDFEDLCVKAWKTLRNHADLLLSLPLLMLGSGLPELESLNRIEFVRKRLLLNLTTDQELEANVRELAEKAEKSFRTPMNNWIHNIAHGDNCAPA